MVFLKTSWIPGPCDIDTSWDDYPQKTSVHLSSGIRKAELLDTRAYSKVTDAYLVHRPYFRILEGVGTVEGHIEFSVDQETVFRGRVSEVLLEHGIIPERHLPLISSKVLFQAREGSDKPGENIGLFLPNGSIVQVSLSKASIKGKDLLVEAGFISALYTN